jgi:hypothetical protein
LQPEKVFMLNEPISARGPIAPLHLDKSGLLKESDDGCEGISAGQA